MTIIVIYRSPFRRGPVIGEDGFSLPTPRLLRYFPQTNQFVPYGFIREDFLEYCPLLLLEKKTVCLYGRQRPLDKRPWKHRRGRRTDSSSMMDMPPTPEKCNPNDRAGVGRGKLVERNGKGKNIPTSHLPPSPLAQTTLCPSQQSNVNFQIYEEEEYNMKLSWKRAKNK